MKKIAAVFGSSSARCFESLITNTYVYPGSTAKGLYNPNSQSKANKNIRLKLKSLQKGTYVIFLFGGVEMNFIINYNHNLNDQFNFEKYIIKCSVKDINFIKKNTNHFNVLICEVPISHITDGNLIKILNFYGKEINHNGLKSKLNTVLPQKIRNKYILLFNESLEKLCEINGFKMLRINKYFKISEGNFKIPAKHIRKDELDHHLRDNIVELYLKSLKDL